MGTVGYRLSQARKHVVTGETSLLELLQVSLAIDATSTKARA